MKKNNSNKFDEILFSIMSICVIVLTIMAVVFTIIACVIILNPEWAAHVAKILNIPVDYLGWFLLWVNKDSVEQWNNLIIIQKNLINF